MCRTGQAGGNLGRVSSIGILLGEEEKHALILCTIIVHVSNVGQYWGVVERSCLVGIHGNVLSTMHDHEAPLS